MSIKETFNVKLVGRINNIRLSGGSSYLQKLTKSQELKDFLDDYTEWEDSEGNKIVTLNCVWKNISSESLGDQVSWLVFLDPLSATRTEEDITIINGYLVSKDMDVAVRSIYISYEWNSLKNAIEKENFSVEKKWHKNIWASNININISHFLPDRQTEIIQNSNRPKVRINFKKWSTVYVNNLVPEHIKMFADAYQKKNLDDIFLESLSKVFPDTDRNRVGINNGDDTKRLMYIKKITKSWDASVRQWYILTQLEDSSIVVKSYEWKKEETIGMEINIDKCKWPETDDIDQTSERLTKVVGDKISNQRFPTSDTWNLWTNNTMKLIFKEDVCVINNIHFEDDKRGFLKPSGMWINRIEFIYQAWSWEEDFVPVISNSRVKNIFSRKWVLWDKRLHHSWGFDDALISIDEVPIGDFVERGAHGRIVSIDDLQQFVKYDIETTKKEKYRDELTQEYFDIIQKRYSEKLKEDVIHQVPITYAWFVRKWDLRIHEFLWTRLCIWIFKNSDLDKESEDPDGYQVHEHIIGKNERDSQSQDDRQKYFKDNWQRYYNPQL